MSAPSLASQARSIRATTWLWLALIVGVAVVGSLWWVQQNVLLVGRDSAGHLEQSVLVQQALAGNVNIGQGPGNVVQRLFRAVTLDDYRPPALYLLTQIPYAIFGQSMDAAQSTNIALLALLLLLTFLLARTMLSDGWALAATALTALLPMIAAMSRLYYMENLLTVAILFNLLALLKSDGFRRRGWALVWGASLGVALLEKWTAPIYLVVPTLYVLWRAGTFAGWQTRLTTLRIDWKRAAIALVLGAALAALWYLPNREQIVAMRMPLGGWLSLLWFLIWTPTLYLLLVRGGSIANLVTALLLALTIASFWYAPRIDFLNRLGGVAFGTDRGTQEAWNLLRLEQYTRYFSYWRTHHMGLLASLLIIPPALVGWWRKRSVWRTPRMSVAVVGLTVLSSWLLLTVVAQANPRNLVPILPAIAILIVEGWRMLGIPAAPLVAGMGLAVLSLQWSIYTFDALAPLYQRTPVLWVHGDYTAWPRTGSSDSGYWIHPDVLTTIRDANPTDNPATLGMLIDSWEIHRGAFRYLNTAEGYNVQINALTEDDTAGWSDLFANEWVLLKDGDNSAVKEPGQRLLAAIANDDALFDRLYKPVREWTLPNGDHATLYRRAEGAPRPLDFPVVLIETAVVADAVRDHWSAGGTLYFTDADTALWVAIHDLGIDFSDPNSRLILPESSETPVDEALAGVTGPIVAVSRYRTPEVIEWLHGHGYVALEVGEGEFRATVATIPDAPLDEISADSTWEEVTVDAVRSLSTIAVGNVLPLDLSFGGRNDGSLKMSLRLRDGSGTDVAQQDVTVLPAARAALWLPAALPPGNYTLGGILYDPATLAPMPDRLGSDFSAIATITVMSARGGDAP